MPLARAPNNSPLTGIRVADFCHVLAGPFCTRILADLGADVIKIEPPGGDVARRLGQRRGGMSGYYMQQNCGKQNVSIDLKSERGRELAAAIASHCDVLVENLRPGVMRSHGLGADTLRQANPMLIYCSISGFGTTGPWRKQRAFAGVVHATTGLLSRQSLASGQPATDSVLALGDTVAGLQSVIAILGALYMRQSSGHGQFIDMAMHDALLSIQEAANFHLFGEGGSDRDFLSSWVYHCGADYVVLPTDPRVHWQQLAELIGRPELAVDARYDSYKKRAASLDQLEAHIQAWIGAQADADTVVAALHRAGLPGARVLSLAEALECEQTRARAMTTTIADRSGRELPVLNSPYRYSDASAGVRGVPAFRGEDNRCVLAELLGLSESELDELERSGVISSRLPRSHDQ